MSMTVFDKITSVCARPMTAEQIADAIGEELGRTRCCIYKLCSLKRLVNLNARQRKHGVFIVPHKASDYEGDIGPALSEASGQAVPLDLALCRPRFDATELTKAWK